MKIIKYFFEFLFIVIFFLIFKIIGYKQSSNLGAFIGKKLGPFFRSNSKIQNNLEKSKIGQSEKEREIIIDSMWGNYGRILSEYIYLKQFKKDNFNQFIEIEGLNYLNDIKKNNEQVIFVSGHFNNFELMAMEIEKAGIDVCAVYRPLNNPFLNIIMERIRKKYVCKNQIKKGINGVRESIEFIKKKHSIALMIDQRVSEGEKVSFFGKPSLTTTLPAQLALKYDLKIIPVFIERIKNDQFKLEFQKEINPNNFKNKLELTKELNIILEKMIVKNPSQWIWTHNRWK